MQGNEQEIFSSGKEIGQLIEAVRTLQSRFSEFEGHVSKRCTDCSMSNQINTFRDAMADHERRLRWVERKLYGAVAVTGILVYLIDKIGFK